MLRSPQLLPGRSHGAPVSRTLQLEVSQLRFLLYELVSSATPAAPPRPISRHDTYSAALAARDRDVMDQLEAAGGRRVELTHMVLSCAETGLWTSQRFVCSVGQPIGWPVDLPSELVETARWLAALRAQA